MANTTNFGWETPDDTDLVKDGAAAIRTLGSAIDTSLVDLKGGTTNQVLAKNSNTDMDFKWVADATGISATIFDAKGDIIAATAADTADRLAVGTNGQVLTADSATATGLKWATPSAGGKIAQVVNATLTGTNSTNSGSLVNTGLTASITPTSATSKILILVNHTGAEISGAASGSGGGYGHFALLRGTTILAKALNGLENMGSLAYPKLENNVNFAYLDSPATTSSTTYKTQYLLSAGYLHYASQTDYPASITLLEVLA